VRAKSEERRQAIMHVATEVFQENGYEATTMSQILERLGGSKATLYAYFPSKEELFMEVMIASVGKQGLLSLETAKAAEDIGEALKNIGLLYVRIRAQPAAVSMHRLAIAEAARSDLGQKFYARGPGRFINDLVEVLQGYIDKAILRREDVTIMAMHLKALYEAEFVTEQALNVRTDYTDAELAEAVERAVTIFLRGYAEKT
jgi:AcrR family transcriptional regulator